MRFLHTADWQMGMKANHVGDAAAKVREARLDAAQQVVSVAREHGIDFLVVAGDLFEDNGVEGVLVQQVADILAAVGKPVYIIPGNHDPVVPGSVWEHPVWSGVKHLHVLRQAEPVDLGEALLFPCPLSEKFSRMDPTSWIDACGESRICIGLAHGTVEDIPSDDSDFPIPRNAAEERGLDYLALGHWHSKKLYPSSDGAFRMAYSGTDEATKFGERDSGNVLIVEISERGVPPSITPVSTGTLNWEKIEKSVQTPDDLDSLVHEIETWQDAERTLLWVVLEGLLFPEARNRLRRMEELLQARFFYGRLDDSGLVPSPKDDTWIDALPAGYLRKVAQQLRDQAIAGAGDEDDAEIARLALLELYVIAEEVGR